MEDNNSGNGMATFHKQDEKYEIMLPCEPEQFAEFVSGLLGKPQTIEKYFRGAFELAREDVINTYHLVHQRITQQNKGNLIQFSVKILYADDSSIFLPTLKDFEYYSEIRPIASVGAVLSWTYLIKFENKKVAEKQEINLSFTSGQTGATYSLEGILEGDSFIHRRYNWNGPRGIFLRINHTDRTWGVDLESLLSGQLKNLLIKRKKIEKFLVKNSGTIGFSVGAAFFLGAMASVVLASQRFIDSYLIKVQTLSDQSSIASDVLTQKLDFLIAVISTGVWPRFVFSAIVFLVVSLIMSVFLGGWVGSKANNTTSSHVLLSKKAIDYKKECSEIIKRDWALFVFSILVSIATGIISSWIFQKYFATLN